MKRSACLLLMLLLVPLASARGEPRVARPATAAAPASQGQALAGRGINLRHFDHLYADRMIDGREMAVVHIYAKHPDYRYAIEPNEGFTCVDDVARALVMLAGEWRHAQDPELLRKIRRLTRFVLHMQNGNGYFNNFLWADNRINVDYRTSVAELNWWSLRALWGLETVYPLLQNDAELAAAIRGATARVVANIVRDLADAPRGTTVVEGIAVPTWLPSQSAADQAAQAIVALLPHWQRTGDAGARRVIEALADGIVAMQQGGASAYPYGMFLSWRNLWHAWGNVQAYALLRAGEQLRRPQYIRAALVEVDHFYPYLLRSGFAQEIELRAEGAERIEARRQRFPQIAYGLRPMVFAALRAHALTRDPKHRRLALDLATWLSGRNDAGAAVYDPATGIVFDGIVGPGRLNRDAGAESTIEALLVLQALRDGRP